MGCLKGSMTSQALGGVNSPCGLYRIRGQPPSTGGWDHKHTHTWLHKYMEEGGKKDAPYIAELFEGKVLEYNPQLLCIDMFYFDGVSNVQKAGEILIANFPCSFCFHGGEHVVSLFFSSIAKIKPVKIHCAGLLCILVEFFSIKYLPCVLVRFWFSKCAGCIMCLDLAQAIKSMHNSWHNQHWPTEVRKCASSKVLVLKWLYGLCHDLSYLSSATIEGHCLSTEIFLIWLWPTVLRRQFRI